jgi:hypothetical protein
MGTNALEIIACILGFSLVLVSIAGMKELLHPGYLVLRHILAPHLFSSLGARFLSLSADLLIQEVIVGFNLRKKPLGKIPIDEVKI